MNNHFIKVKDASTGRFLYINIDGILMMFAADDDPDKTIMLVNYKYDGIYTRLILNEKVEDVYNAIEACCVGYVGDQFQ